VWLREDPGYFRNVIGDTIEHSNEALPYESGKIQNPDIGRVFRRIVANAYTSLWVGGLARKQLEHLFILREHYGERISPRQKLPVDYEEAFIQFSHLMVRHVTSLWNVSRMAYSRLPHCVVTSSACNAAIQPMHIFAARTKLAKTVSFGCSSNSASRRTF